MPILPLFPLLPVRWMLILWVPLGLMMALRAEPVVVINEFKSDPPGSDTREFIELFAYDSATGEAMGQFPLDGHVVVLFNGNSAVNAAYAVTPADGSSRAAMALDGYRTNAAGFFALGSPDVAGVDLVLLPGSTGWLQNGPDGIGLYKNLPIDFAVGSEALADGLVDALVYGTDDPEDVDLLAILSPGVGQINELPNSVFSLARVPDGGAPFAAELFTPQSPTPGSRNLPTDGLLISLDPPTLAEGETRTGRVSRTGSTGADLIVTFSSSDAMELAAPSPVLIPAGTGSAPVEIRSEDNSWPDGAREVEVTASAPGYLAAVLKLTIHDDSDTTQPVVLNEVFASGVGDANRDGANATNQDRFNDEFVEFVNRSIAEVDLSGFHIVVSAIDSPRHTFSAGTRLPAGAALVVFGGGSPSLGITEEFGNAWIQVANAPALGLFLLEPAGRVSLRNPEGTEVAAFRYDHQLGSVESVTRSPDLIGPATPHGLAGDGSLLFSPGTRGDGGGFATVAHRLECAIEPSSVLEHAGPQAASLIVTRSGPTDRPLVVSVVPRDASEAVPSAPSLTIPAGETTARLPIDVIDDTATDGPQMAGFSCIAAGHLNGSATLQVEDDGFDRPPTAVFINEIDTDQPGADAGEFIELYVGEPAARALDGYVVVLFNGNHSSNGAYAVIDLAGHSSNARGLFVIGNASVPHVDLTIPNASIQNGADAVAVYRAPASSFSTGGTGTPPTPDSLVDVVIYGNGSGQDFDLIAGFQALGDPRSDGLVQHNEGEPNNPHSLARIPDAVTPFGLFVTSPPTPGLPNDERPGVMPSIRVAFENGTVAIEFTGSLESATSLQSGAFRPVPDATSPHRLPLPLEGSRFFRAVAR
ncbi:MAG: lamin tail domain-containing protein [Verrucomicrobiales bacterium]